MLDIARLTTALADRYTLVRELGAGGMVTVYLAEDLKHRGQVAVMGAYMSAEQGKTLKFPVEGIDEFVPKAARGEWRP